MQFDHDTSKALSFTCDVFNLYLELMSDADSSHGMGLGGKLLFAAELDERGRALVVAGNVAGAASLAASADAIAQKDAVRDGVADFLVTSLDEALRIVKNEIRKHETVAVCIGLAPDVVEREMLERGVLPHANAHQNTKFAIVRPAPHLFDKPRGKVFLSLDKMHPVCHTTKIAVRKAQPTS